MSDDGTELHGGRYLWSPAACYWDRVWRVKQPARKTPDLEGARFGKMVVLSHAGSGDRRRSQWLVRCDCGRRVIKSLTALRIGYSCGCERRPYGSRLPELADKSRTS